MRSSESRASRRDRGARHRLLIDVLTPHEPSRTRCWRASRLPESISCWVSWGPRGSARTGTDLFFRWTDPGRRKN